MEKSQGKRTDTELSNNSVTKLQQAADLGFDELMEKVQGAVEKVRREKQSENAVNRYTKGEGLASRKKLREAKDRYDENTASQKLADLHGTNRTYIQQAAQIKEDAPINWVV